VSNLVLFHKIKWFDANTKFLNLDITNTMKSITKNSSHSTFHIGYKEKCIEERVNTTFLGSQMIQFNSIYLRSSVPGEVLDPQDVELVN
jgi:hypothetical protein